MRKEDLKFEIFSRNKTEYYKGMLFDRFREDKKEIAEEILKASENTEDFIDKYLDDERLEKFYGRNRLAKEFRPDTYWMTIRKFLGDKIFKTESDAGSVLIGRKKLKIMIPNGRGDGESRVAILDKNEDISGYELNNFTLIEGKFKIYNYDCTKDEDDYAEELNGKYVVYYYDSFVVFQELN